MRARAHGRTALAIAVLACAGCAPALRTPPPPPESHAGSVDPAELRRRAGALLDRREIEAVRSSVDLWKEAIASEPDPYDALEGLVRSLVWLAGKEPDPERRKTAATDAVHGGQWCRERYPESPRCAYWLGVALGVQARERRATALDAIGPMEELLREAMEGDPGLDHAGPARVLALLYTRAPGWPRGPGDPDEGVALARTALGRDPDYPPNRMALAEALEAAGERDGSRAEYLAALDRARTLADAGSAQAAEWVVEIERSLSSR